MNLTEIGQASFTIEALDKIEKMLDKQIAKENKKLASWVAEDFIFPENEDEGY
jgi:predicted transcriptional regulator|tara:strand:+ start:4467 stop:4625 length:159 start_codon:yes stop_codon:yes gene_type:complete